MNDFIIVIPARLKSTRLPEKPLIEILGKSIILRTYEQCLKAVDSKLVYVATDSEKIKLHCQSHGIKVIMTSDKALTGTDRVWEVARKIKAKYYINVQGDEPVFNPADIKLIINEVKNRIDSTDILNGFTNIKNEDEYRSPTVPKVVFKPNGELLYMSRSPIPGNKLQEFVKSWRQVCIYAFPYEALRNFSKISKTTLESEEDIEILRFLELNYRVQMIKLSSQSIPVDIPSDIFKVENFLKSAQISK